MSRVYTWAEEQGIVHCVVCKDVFLKKKSTHFLCGKDSCKKSYQKVKAHVLKIYKKENKS